MTKKAFFLACALLICHTIFAQKEDLTQVWPAKWIQGQTGPVKEYAVYHFRKSFTLDTIPQSLVINTSGDNRYQLYVNEQLVTWGPLRGDLRHWYYETTDLKPYLRKGKNVIAALVHNYGSHPPDAQVTVQTGFVLAAADKKFRFLNTDKSWKVVWNQAYMPNRIDKSQVNGYYGGGSREIMDANKFVWGWQQVALDDSNWENAQEVENAMAKTCIWASRWKLMPRHLPLERLQNDRFKSVRIAEGVSIPQAFPAQPADITIPARTKARFVLDQGHETTAYPVIDFSGGKNASIKMTYVEAPYIDLAKKEKGNRNEVEGKIFFGYFDKVIADGQPKRIYQPIWWRAFRYIEVTVETQNEPLVIHDMRNVFSTYPFKQKARFTASGHPNTDTALIKNIFDIGIRTTRLCSHETFMDCPYYEESQFEGDSRVEMLVSYFNFGDPALGKNAIEQFDWSRNEEGFLSARYPTNSLYYIPNFSIYWIGMLHDYMLYYGERDFIAGKMMGVRTILDYFLKRQRPDGSIKRPDYHNFVDWALKNGEGAFDNNGYSALVDLHVLQALQWAAALEQYAGDAYHANLYAKQAEKMTKMIRKTYWDNSKKLYTDTPKGTQRSQHTNCMAILTGVSKGEEAKQLMHKVLAKENNMTAATLYWQFYVFEALQQAGLGNLYLGNLGTWKAMIDVGVTTWPETGVNSRSECHGWGASPNYHFFKITAGIASLKAGFEEIQIAPNFGSTNQIQAAMPHKNGQISLNARKLDSKRIEAEVELPANTTGLFVWQGKKMKLKAGKQVVRM